MAVALLAGGLDARELSRCAAKMGEIDWNTRAWFVRSHDGRQSNDPVSLAKLARGIELGKLTPEMQVARAGTEEWQTLGVLLARSMHLAPAPRHAPAEVGPPASARASQLEATYQIPRPAPVPAVDSRSATMPPTRAERPTGSRIWIQVATILNGVICLTLIVAVVLAWRAHDADRIARNAAFAQLSSQLGARLQGVQDELASQKATTWIAAGDTVFTCIGTNAEVTCTVTNVRSDAITTCVRATLAKKEAKGIVLESLPMCTGRLGPRETRTVAAPWSGGFARDLCNRKSPYGGEVLDWDACNFVTHPLDLPSLEKSQSPTRSAAGASPSSTSL